jgi:hypothetical protein
MQLATLPMGNRQINFWRGLVANKSDDMVRCKQRRQLERARCKAPIGQQDVIEFHSTQLPDQAYPAQISLPHRLPGRVLALGIGEDGVQTGVSGNRRLIVTIDQRRNVGLRILLAKRCKQGGGADQIANVVATDNQDSGRTQNDNSYG